MLEGFPVHEGKINSIFVPKPGIPIMRCLPQTVPRHLSTHTTPQSLSQAPLEETWSCLHYPEGFRFRLLPSTSSWTPLQKESSHESREDSLSSILAHYLPSQITSTLTLTSVPYLRDQRDDGLPSMATNHWNSYFSWIQALKETRNFPASEAHGQEKVVKTPHFTLCPGYQDTQGRSSRGSCTPGTKPHLQSGTLGYSDHFVQLQDIISAGLDKEQHNINTSRAIKSSNLSQLLIFAPILWHTAQSLPCKHTPQLNPLLWLHGRVGNAKGIKANT